MLIRYKPDDGSEAKLYEIRWGKIPRSRGALAEKIYAKAIGERRTWEQLKADAIGGGLTARAVALWLAMTQEHPLLRFEDLPDCDTEAIEMEYSKEELRQMRTGLERNTTMLETERAMQLEALAIAIEEAPAGSDEPEPKPDPDVKEPADETGKAPDTSGEPSTS